MLLLAAALLFAGCGSPGTSYPSADPEEVIVVEPDMGGDTDDAGPDDLGGSDDGGDVSDDSTDDSGSPDVEPDGDRPDGDRPDADAGAPDADASAPDADAPAILANWQIHVFDVSGMPVPRAHVTLGDLTIDTDAGGSLTFSGLTPDRYVAQIDASGFAPATAVAELVGDVTNYSAVYLLPVSPPVAIDEDLGGRAVVDGVIVSLPPDALVTADGLPVEGMIDVEIAPLDPSTRELRASPGPLEGLTELTGETVSLESLFMAEISLRQNGDLLQLADGVEALVEMQLPSDMIGSVSEGDVIEAWWFDLENGQWIEEGLGEVTESSLDPGELAWRVRVEHFTWWNCDRPWTQKNCIDITVVSDLDGSPVAGANVTATGVDYNGMSYGTTDAAGHVCVDMMLGGTVDIDVFHADYMGIVGGAPQVTGTGGAAACSGEGGDCEVLSVALDAGTCIEGLVEHDDGSPAEDASIISRFDLGNGLQSRTATAGPSGEYCVEAPSDTDVELIAIYAESGGDTFIAETSVFTDDVRASCGGDDCVEAPVLTLEVTDELSCVTGRIVGRGGADGTDPDLGLVGLEGVPVMMYADFPAPTCDGQPVESWGTLLGQAVSGPDGRFCIAAPVTPNPDGVFFIVGDCDHCEPMFAERGPGDVMTERAGSCGDPDTCSSVGELWTQASCWL